MVIFLIIVSLTALSKLCQLSKPIEVTADPDSLTLDSRRKRSKEKDLEKTNSTKLFYTEDTTRTNLLKTDSKLSAEILRKYAQAFVRGQSYMERTRKSFICGL